MLKETIAIVDIATSMGAKIECLESMLVDYRRLCKAQERSLLLLGIFPDSDKPTSLENIRQTRSDILHMCDYIRASATDAPISGNTCNKALLAQERMRERLSGEKENGDV